MVNSDDWFENPLDSMPIAKDDPLPIRPVFDGCSNSNIFSGGAYLFLGRSLLTNPSAFNLS